MAASRLVPAPPGVAERELSLGAAEREIAGIPVRILPAGVVLSDRADSRSDLGIADRFTGASAALVWITARVGELDGSGHVGAICAQQLERLSCGQPCPDSPPLTNVGIVGEQVVGNDVSVAPENGAAPTGSDRLTRIVFGSSSHAAL
nr:hypothetical protein [Cryobacterium sp. M91]